MTADPEFTVSVESGFDEEGIWVIYPAVTYRADVSSERRKALAGEVQEAIYETLGTEYGRARMLGAHNARLVLHGLRDEFGCTISPFTISLIDRSTASDRDQLLVLEYLYGRRRKG